ncbi:MAG: ribonuclease J, partial [Synergistaceae bacterium]|nr:ribonuclease J [Synergistaceae bacterium]
IRLGERDTVVISATPIPGNEKLVSNTINRLFECGCDVIYERDMAVHASGHASREEQKILISLVKPKYFMPVHGEYRHLVRHSQLASEMGISSKNIFVVGNGDVLELDPAGTLRKASRVASGSVLVDGVMLGEFEGSLLRERRELSESGVMAVSVVVDEDYRLVSAPQIDSRGSIYGFEEEHMRPDIASAVERALDNVRSGAADSSSIAIAAEIRRKIREVIGKNYRAYPAIMPLVNVVGTDDGRPVSSGRNGGYPKPRTQEKFAQQGRGKVV